MTSDNSRSKERPTQPLPKKAVRKSEEVPQKKKTVLKISKKMKQKINLLNKNLSQLIITLIHT